MGQSNDREADARGTEDACSFRAVALCINLTPDRKWALQEHRGIDPALAPSGLEWLAYLSHTQRPYLKEAERRALAMAVKGKQTTRRWSKLKEWLIPEP